MYNANVGVLGHVDSGKTSLSKVLSTHASTASFDKNPQSQERGITLDLGFSACHIPAEQLAEASERSKGVTCYNTTKEFTQGLQLTFVDCPGHASLIRTIMGGAQIIDVMMLVIDVTKGIQTQTSECIVVGEMLGRRLLVALNKVDMVAGATPEEKGKNLDKMKKILKKVFQTQTRWPSVQFIEVAAAPGDGSPAQGIQELTNAVVSLVNPQALVDARKGALTTGSTKASQNNNFLLAVDHCFLIKGQGTVMTGTILEGKVSVGDEVDLPDYGLRRKVKGIQVFKKPVKEAFKGDRIGMNVPQFDTKEMERGLVCSPGSGVISISCAILQVHKVRFYKQAVDNGQKFHVTVGHNTVMGTMRFFSKVRTLATAGGADAEEKKSSTADLPLQFDPSAEYLYEENLPDSSALEYQALPDNAVPGEPCASSASTASGVDYFAVLQLEQPVTTKLGTTFIASKLDTTHEKVCRLAVQGTLLSTMAGKATAQQQGAGTANAGDTETWRQLRVVKNKLKTIQVDRTTDDHNCIVKSFVNDGGEAPKFSGLHVYYTAPKSETKKAEGEEDGKEVDSEGVETDLLDPNSIDRSLPGVLEAPFGKSGKMKVRFLKPVFQGLPEGSGAGGKKGKGGKKGGGGDVGASLQVGTILLPFKKYPFAHTSRLSQ